MSQSVSAYLVLGLALILANLPFINQRTLAVLPRKAAGRKRIAQQLLEWLVL